jgi:hypothetical protein
MREKLEPVTEEWFEGMKKQLEDNGYKVKNKWRKGTVAIHLEEIVLSENK